MIDGIFLSNPQQLSFQHPEMQDLKACACRVDGDHLIYVKPLLIYVVDADGGMRERGVLVDLMLDIRLLVSR